MKTDRPVVQAVVVKLPAPISVNAIWRSYIRGGRLTTIKSEKYRAFEREAAQMIALQKIGRIEGAYGLTIKLPRKSRLDLCNAAKCINDVAQHHGIVENDRFCKRLLVEPGVEDETVCFFISTKEG